MVGQGFYEAILIKLYYNCECLLCLGNSACGLGITASSQYYAPTTKSSACCSTYSARILRVRNLCWALVVEAWSGMPEVIRTAIVAMVRASTDKQEG